MARRVAVASRDGALVDQHFGSAAYFRIYDIEQNQVRLVEVRGNRPSCGLERDEGAGHAPPFINLLVAIIPLARMRLPSEPPGGWHRASLWTRALRRPQRDRAAPAAA
jgi:hypothetical protein